MIESAVLKRLCGLLCLVVMLNSFEKIESFFTFLWYLTHF